MDTASRVIYVGTFSRAMFPSLRIGYIAAPPSLVTALIEHRDALDLFPSTLNQLALTEFLCQGCFARHVRRMRAIYLERRDALVSGIERRLTGLLTVVNADVGMHLAAWLPPELDDRDVVRRAEARGIFANALSNCYMASAPRPGLVLGFGGTDERQIVQGLEVLGDVIERCVRNGQAGRSSSTMSSRTRFSVP
jgi:GntR family transcriptional regulator/MocR family aminotransferase